MGERILQPHELAERGLWGPPQPGPATAGKEIIEMPLSLDRTAPRTDMYVAQEDVIETLEDGRTIQIAVAGGSIPMKEAIRLQLPGTAQEETVPKKKEAPAPSESKPETGPSEKK